MHVDEKRRVVGELAERIRAADSMIIADYRGLTVTQIANVRGASGRNRRGCRGPSWW